MFFFIVKDIFLYNNYCQLIKCKEFVILAFNFIDFAYYINFFYSYYYSLFTFLQPMI